jgi:hypothetical protein
MDDAVVIDLDGTLVANQHRPLAGYLKSDGTHDWDRWLKDSVSDPIAPWCNELVLAMMAHDCHIVFLTGRRESDSRTVTEQWLHRFYGGAGYTLIMRGADDYRDAGLVKLDALTTKILPFWNVLFAVDDLAENAQVFRNLGITCLHCSDY